MNCIEVAVKAAAGRLTTSEIDDAISEVDKIKEALIVAGKTDNLDQRAMSIAMNRAMEKKIEAARLKRQIAQNIKARAAAEVQIKEHLDAGRTPLQALRSLYEGSQQAVKGARSSAAAQGLAYEAKWIGSFFAGVQKERPHLLRMMGDKNLDTAVTREMWELREGGSPGSTGNADAQWLARELAAHMEMARTELNRLGAAIGKLDGYAGPQVHDDLAMLKAGREAWVDQILPLLDIGRSFPEATSEVEVRGILASTWDTIITGVRQTDTSPLLTGQRIGPSNLAKRLGKHRVLHFRDAEAALQYRDIFGRGSTIQGILGQLRHGAHSAGVFDRFGPNPRTMMNALAARLQQDLRAKVASATDPKVIARLNKQLEELTTSNGEATRLQATMDQATGLHGQPVSTSTAALGSNIRAWLQMSKLGGATLSSVPSDVMTSGAAAMMRGQGMLNGLFRTLGEVMNRPNGKEIAFLLGEGFDGIVGHIGSASVPFDLAPGVISKVTMNFFRLSGLTGWTDTIRAASARVIAAHLGSNAGKSFEGLDTSLRHVLGLNGIDAAKWEAIRSAGYREVNGHRYVTPDAIRSLDDATIEPIVASRIEEARAAILKPGKSGKVSEAAHAKFVEKRGQIIADGRRELELDLHRYYADETSYAVIETDAKTQRIVTGGHRPGTLAGEAMRYVAQFKAFPAAFSQRMLGRALFNAPAGRGTQLAHIGQLLAGLTIAGYMAMTVKDAFRGLWPPRDPFSPETWGAAFVQGGGAGIYGDFLFGQKSRFDQGIVETLSGPAVGVASDLFSLYQQARAGEPNAGKALDVALNNTPFINLFYARSALDFLFLNALRETVKPGYLARQEARTKKERGQEFVLPRTLGEALQ